MVNFIWAEAEFFPQIQKTDLSAINNTFRVIKFQKQKAQGIAPFLVRVCIFIEELFRDRNQDHILSNLHLLYPIRFL